MNLSRTRRGSKKLIVQCVTPLYTEYDSLQVGSRRVVLVAGLIMLVLACFSKFSALIVTIPDPIIGAAFIVLFGK